MGFKRLFAKVGGEGGLSLDFSPFFFVLGRHWGIYVLFDVSFIFKRF